MPNDPSPQRIHDLDATRARLGPRVDEVARWYDVGDPDWPLVHPPSRVPAPAWLDPDRCDRAGLTLRRHGLLTSAVLRSYALPLSYLSPVGIRPLTFSGQLVQHAGPRLYRTAEYVIETQQPGAMHPDGPAWATAARVRTGHQHVRQQLIAAGWPEGVGAPIPQPDTAATALLFGPLVVEGLRRLGATISEAEADDVAHLARAMAHGQGTVPALQADTHADAMHLFEVVSTLNGPPDADARALMEALLDVPHQLARRRMDHAIAPALKTFYRSLAVHLLGPEYAQGLGLRGRGRLGRPVGWVARSPLNHPRLAAVHDVTVEWVLARGRRRMGSRAT